MTQLGLVSRNQFLKITIFIDRAILTKMATIFSTLLKCNQIQDKVPKVDQRIPQI